MSAPEPSEPSSALVELRLQIPPDLHRAFQRCIWVCINETGQTQLQIMEEIIRNFLKEHGC